MEGKVKPAWEDKFNAHGGAWAFRFAPKAKNRDNRGHDRRNQGGYEEDSTQAATAANYAWYHSVLNMIGNNFNHSEDICGLVINIKKGGRGKIELWIKDAHSQHKVTEIGLQFKEFCGAARKKNVEIEFMSFESQLKKGRGNKKRLNCERVCLFYRNFCLVVALDVCVFFDFCVWRYLIIQKSVHHMYQYSITTVLFTLFFMSSAI